MLPCTGYWPSPVLVTSAVLELCLAAGAGTSDVPRRAQNRQGSRAVAAVGVLAWEGKFPVPFPKRCPGWKPSVRCQPSRAGQVLRRAGETRARAAFRKHGFPLGTHQWGRLRLLSLDGEK